jgi:L-threonylcarbamoyladenylate synthase
VTREQLEAVLHGPVALASTTVSADAGSTRAQRSPGMADRHYAPRADVWLFDPMQTDEVTEALRQRHEQGNRTPVRALLLETRVTLSAGDRVIDMPGDPAAYARRLYALLHDADTDGVTLLLIERPPATDAWTAVRDRLTRAAR